MTGKLTEGPDVVPGAVPFVAGNPLYLSCEVGSRLIVMQAPLLQLKYQLFATLPQGAVLRVEADKVDLPDENASGLPGRPGGFWR